MMARSQHALVRELRRGHTLPVLTVVAMVAALLMFPVVAAASHTPAPALVTVAGSLQSELGCPGDWQPDCAATHLTYDVNDGVWQGVFAVPAGAWEYKAALNDSWTENYGANATQDGPNISLVLGAPTDVKFYYDHETHWITDNRNSVIATVPGNYQSQLGCPGDWDPGCLRSWLQDPDGDGTYLFSTTAIPPGSYEAKVAIDETWAENYGAGGVQNGPNIPFTVMAPNSMVSFLYDPVIHILSVNVSGPPLTSVTVVGDFQSELGCAGDWQADCVITHLTYDGTGDVWRSVFAVPAGAWEAKAALNDSWYENYGAGGVQNGPNIPFTVGTGQTVGFSWDSASKVLTISLSPAVDTDGDGVIDADDLCPDTDLGGDTAPSRHNKNRLWSDPNGSFLFGDGTDSGITVADTGGCSASQIIEAAGLGNGHARFGISKSAMAAYLASLEEVGLLAVAWSEVDGQPGYDPAGDVLIAQFEDVDGNGTPSIGDIVRTDQYPKAQTPSGFGSFTVKEHVVGSHGFAYQTYTSTELTVGLTDDLGNIDQFSWNADSTGEGYSEVSEFGFVTGFTDRFAALDEVLVDPASPSVPDGFFQPNDVIGAGDDDFINVVITPPAP